MTLIQVDNSAGHGTPGILNLEEKGSRDFHCKPRQILERGKKVSFNGTMIRRNENGFEMRQPGKLSALKEATSTKEAISIRAAIQYIAGCMRPDLASATKLLSTSVANPDAETLKKLNEIVRRAKSTASMGLKYCKLNPDTVEQYLFTDASFGNAENGASQVGFVLCLVDGNTNANILHYGSQRCRRVTRSAMAAEILSLGYGFDQAIFARSILEELLGRSIKLHALIDSRTVFNTVTKGGPTLERRIQIDAHALRQSHERGELASISWIQSGEIVADALTKTLLNESHILYDLLPDKTLRINPQGWVEQSSSTTEKPQVSRTRYSTKNGFNFPNGLMNKKTEQTGSKN